MNPVKPIYELVVDIPALSFYTTWIDDSADGSSVLELESGLDNHTRTWFSPVVDVTDVIGGSVNNQWPVKAVQIKGV